jgi:hypothetical protein
VSRSSIRDLLSFLEKFGSTVVPARSVERLASADARAALHAAGVLTPAPPAATWPCDVRGCAREIRANYDGARKPLVAVCCQAPPVCTPVELGFDDVAHQEILVDALLSAACALFGAVVDRAAAGTLNARHPIGDARPPVLVATTTEPARDIFWLRSPRDLELGGFCARRERVARGSLVLVPTSEHVPLDVAARFAPGEHVEVRALADAVEVRDGLLVLGAASQAPPAMLSSFPPSQPSSASSSRGLAALLGVTSWGEIRLSVIDGHTLRIEANGQTVLRTFVELGFVDGRKTDIVTPVTAWGVLLLLVRKGELRPSEYGQVGKAYGAKKAIERLGAPMRAVFGLEEHPIHEYSRRHGRWIPRFRVAAGESGAVKEKMGKRGKGKGPERN